MLNTDTRRSGAAKASGSSTTVRRTVKIAVFAPMQSASVNSAVMANAFSFQRSFSPKRKSCSMSPHQTHTPRAGREFAELLDNVERVQLADAPRASGGVAAAGGKDAVLARPKVRRQNNLVRARGDFLVLERNRIARRAARRVQYAARHRAELARVLLCVQPNQLILGGRRALRRVNQDLDRRLQGVWTVLAIQVAIDVALDDSRGADR